MDTTSTETVKICPTCDNSAMWAALANQSNQTSPAEMMAMLNNNGTNAWQNSPFAYIMFMMLFRMFGNGWGMDGTSAGENTNSRAIATLQDTVANNHNNDLVMQALSNNQSAIRELAQTFNTDLSNIQQACCNINAAIAQVGGQVGYSAESVKNAIALGDSNIMSKMQDCCCQVKTAIIDGNYQNQLATERQTGILGSKLDNNHSADLLQASQNQAQTMSRIDQLANGITQGFASIGYATQAQTNEIVQAGNANTQRILDAMCSQSTQALRDQLADKDRQLQTANIINQLKASGCNCSV